MGNPLVRNGTVIGIVSEVTLSDFTLPTLFIKVSAFEDYITKAKNRLIENQDLEKKRRNNEECTESSNRHPNVGISL